MDGGLSAMTTFVEVCLHFAPFGVQDSLIAREIGANLGPAFRSLVLCDLLEARYEVPEVPGGKSCRREVLRGLRRFARDPVPRLWRGAHAREEVLRLVWRADVLGQARRALGQTDRASGQARRAHGEACRAPGRGGRSLRLSPVLHAQAPGRENPHLQGR